MLDFGTVIICNFCLEEYMCVCDSCDCGDKKEKSPDKAYKTKEEYEEAKQRLLGALVRVENSKKGRGRI